MNYPLIGGPHNGEVFHAEPGAASPNQLTRVSHGAQYSYYWSDMYRAYVLFGYAPTNDDLRFSGVQRGVSAGEVTTLDNQPHLIALPYEQTKLALESALDHIQGNLRRTEEEKHSPRTLLAIQTLYTADAERIKQLLTRFTP